MGEKILHILKTEPDEAQRLLMDRISHGRESREIRLFDGEGNVDYGKLLELIFDADRIITWW